MRAHYRVDRSELIMVNDPVAHEGRYRAARAARKRQASTADRNAHRYKQTPADTPLT